MGCCDSLRRYMARDPENDFADIVARSIPGGEDGVPIHAADYTDCVRTGGG